VRILALYVSRHLADRGFRENPVAAELPDISFKDLNLPALRAGTWAMWEQKMNPSRGRGNRCAHAAHYHPHTDYLLSALRQKDVSLSAILRQIQSAKVDDQVCDSPHPKIAEGAEGQYVLARRPSPSPPRKAFLDRFHFGALGDEALIAVGIERY